MQTKDKLEELFRMQKALNRRVSLDTDNLSDEDKTKWLLNYSRATQQELAELVDSVPWKWWAKYQKFDEQNARVEVVDLFHFIISMAQVLGMSAEDLFSAYVQKNAVNFQRQDDGYAKKDENDSRHILVEPEIKPGICTNCNNSSEHLQTVNDETRLCRGCIETLP